MPVSKSIKIIALGSLEGVLNCLILIIGPNVQISRIRDDVKLPQTIDFILFADSTTLFILFLYFFYTFLYFLYFSLGFFGFQSLEQY